MEQVPWNHSILFVLIAGILPRLYFGLHYVSDMALGMAIAVCSSIIIEKINLFKSLSEKILELERRFPYLFGVISFYTAYVIAEKFVLLRKLPLWIRAMLEH